MHCTGTHAPEVEDLHMAWMKLILMSHSELEYDSIAKWQKNWSGPLWRVFSNFGKEVKCTEKKPRAMLQCCNVMN